VTAAIGIVRLQAVKTGAGLACLAIKLHCPLSSPIFAG